MFRSFRNALRRARRAARQDDAERRQFVADVFHKVLYRPPSENETAALGRALARGMSPGRLVREISTSEEARALEAKLHASLELQREGASETARNVGLMYQVLLGRAPSETELSERIEHLGRGARFASMFAETYASVEAQAFRKGQELFEDLPDGTFVGWLYEIVLGRGATAPEVEYARSRLRSGERSRQDFVLTLFHRRMEERLAATRQAPRHDSSTCMILGTGEFVGANEWRTKAAEAAEAAGAVLSPRYSRFPPPRRSPSPRVSILTSLYRGGEFIERFLENITRQTFFDACELIIIDADSPERESEIVDNFRSRFPQIVYVRVPYRIGIYSAWNMGVAMARGDYLTNANVDDLRREDSLELQAAALDALPFADVVYQDVLYTFDAALTYEEVSAVGVKTDTPVITPHNLSLYNSPHNAPMWRKSIHADVGVFNDHLRSAGDWEFWIRSQIAGKTFFKLNDPHVVYYQNPTGISTRPETEGVREALEISRQFRARLAPAAALEEPESFLRRCAGTDPDEKATLEGPRYDHLQTLLVRAARQHESGKGAR